MQTAKHPHKTILIARGTQQEIIDVLCVLYQYQNVMALSSYIQTKMFSFRE